MAEAAAPTGQARPGPAKQGPDAPPGHGRRRAAFGFVFVTVAIDMLSVGIFVPVLPRLVADFMGGDEVAAASMYGLFGTAFALMQFAFSPVQGALSDRFGRRPVILISNLGVGLDYVVMALAPSIWWLLAGRVISGIASASIATAFAYIADVTEPEKRAARFGMLGAAFGLGFVLGPAIGGLAGSVDPRLPFWIAAGLSLLNACYGYFVLPESLPPEKRAPLSLARANPLGALVLLRSQPQLLGLAGVWFVSQLAHFVLPTIGVLYLTFRYGWDERTIGFTMAAVGLAAVIVQGGLIGPGVRLVGERAALIGGFAAGMVGLSIQGLAPEGWMFWLGIPFTSLWGFANAAGNSLMSRRLGPSEQGRLQGANACLMGIAGLIGPGLFSQVYALALASPGTFPGPGAPFFLAVALILVAMLMAVRASR
ncbi:TCR/Tet family MFS transporter [Rhodoplanes sp. TEM]|uniref:TCR/Tet family MFS transporter n=1 Tax=Rhodoplanes tepidamans TaxID=200616 RepID=A0ABT5JF93_RHOTP|nr:MULTISPECIES: TCR/Tet family MFS transporter [Rhodoplanes]MDC7788088.1 TCR/Tet family MFS transporter [Rhodoplanes tepidamans]MDC7987775.1 TCR/Tet family MFS transporter [Rhodoplanes sp. TEM]MDQ0355622.1 DHA1 family tetracycline resistance protein-like MFS transporter [Rhodoplanes tepidamans]